VDVGVTRIDSPGRNETHLERCDRNLVELIQEVRVMQTGVQVMFAFLLTAPLAPRFDTLTASQRAGYFATLLAAGAATVLLIAPTAYHRILFRLGDKEHVVLVANRLTLAGLGCVGVSIAGAILFVSDLVFEGSLIVLSTGLAVMACLTFWCIAPLLRRRSLRARIASVALGPMTRSMAETTTHKTTDHEEIRRWAESHGGRPVTVKGTGNGGPGVLTIDFPGGAGEESLQPISWDEWLRKFDENQLALLYQDEKADGEDSTFFKLVRRDDS
jgi:hypothetical protein